MIGSRGLNLSGGQRQRVALARAVYARCELVLLDDCLSALDGKTESRIVENLLGPEGLFRKTGTTAFLVTKRIALHFRLADRLVIVWDGRLTYQGTWTNFREDPNHVLKLDINSETQNSVAEEKPKLDETVQNQSLKVAEATDDLSRATGDISLYGYYLRAIAWASTNGSMWSTHILIAPSSGIELHRRLLSTIIGAPLLYFSTTDTGVILNRSATTFSQDMQLVDKQLPPSVLAISNQIFKLLLQTILLFSAQKQMTLTLPLCVATIYVVQRIYLRTSRQLRLLDLESQSAVYSSFLESVEGLATIRAFGWEKQTEQANICSLDKSQQPAYVLFCLQQSLGIVLDLMIAAVATGVINLALFLRGTTTAGQIGMALNIVLVANATLLSLMTSWTNMEISLGALSRLKSLEANTPKEDKPYEDYVPADPWPSSGALEFEDVTVAYNPEARALQDVTLKISAGQQLAVCGRTGSGKSTMLLTLLRLVDINLEPSKCFITVGQDALVLSQASLRFNLDPYSSLSDETIRVALQRTNLWKHFNAGSSLVVRDPQKPTTASDILDIPIASLPQMSTGQSQLFAVARAILQLQSLRNNHESQPDEPYYDNTTRRQTMPILLLDEATSSLDPESRIRHSCHHPPGVY
ncbi:ATP-dependent bile acid permease [Madurella fahalii]|uniref:ATP-dependent bile acid permease n=1 Tax=Madurella fahalii TaxID=1157608 RepID=A0ABQ0G4P0_9PEZI